MVVKRNRATRNHCHEALREFLNSRFISVWVEGRGGVPGRYRRLWYQDVSTARNRVSAEIKTPSVSSVPVISSLLRSDFNLGKYSAAKLQEQTETRESVPKGSVQTSGSGWLFARWPNSVGRRPLPNLGARSVAHLRETLGLSGRDCQVTEWWSADSCERLYDRAVQFARSQRRMNLMAAQIQGALATRSAEVLSLDRILNAIGVSVYGLPAFPRGAELLGPLTTRPANE
jgi:hypothetical protein